MNAFTVDFDVDIYITGSNSHLLSSELSTYLAGRYIEILIYTLSFKEFLDFKAYYSDETQSNLQLFNEYLRKGGFPLVHTGNYSEEAIYKIVQDILA